MHGMRHGHLRSTNRPVRMLGVLGRHLRFYAGRVCLSRLRRWHLQSQHRSEQLPRMRTRDLLAGEPPSHLPIVSSRPLSACCWLIECIIMSPVSHGFVWSGTGTSDVSAVCTGYVQQCHRVRCHGFVRGMCGWQIQSNRRPVVLPRVFEPRCLSRRLDIAKPHVYEPAAFSQSHRGMATLMWWMVLYRSVGIVSRCSLRVRPLPARLVLQLEHCRGVSC